MVSADDETVAGNARRVLVVDDNQPLRESLEKVLQAFGYEVEVACDGLEALGMVGTGSYDAILCDLLMPRMSGHELFEACREQCPDELPKFIFLTGSVSGYETQNLLNEMGRPWLPKPCRIAQLRSVIETVVGPTLQ